jgi:hypothetical protein
MSSAELDPEAFNIVRGDPDYAYAIKDDMEQTLL